MTTLTDTDRAEIRLTANTVRMLAVDAVQKASSGHPGMPMGMADVAVTLWSRFLRFDPQDPAWPDRDRFVLSGGHGSSLLYALLHLSGYDLPLEELKRFRQWGSRTPGHPERGHTAGVETTTGPLGQGVCNAIGMALAERHLAARYNAEGLPVVDHHTFCLAGDGDLMEGITHEACSLAGHLGLGRLTLLWDDNGISIDGPTSITFTEDVLGRFAAYGWHTARVDGHDPDAVAAALEAARAETTRPSIIACRTHIGYGSPNRQDTSKAHGEPLGAEEIQLTKEKLGWPLEPTFHVPEGATACLHRAAERGHALNLAWQALRDRHAAAHPALAAELAARLSGALPAGWQGKLPAFAPDKPLATRAASGAVLAALAPVIPALLGGSADLTPSNNTLPKGAEPIAAGRLGGRYLHYGVREHAMGGVMNGLALHGGFRPYGGTFLVFSDYMKGSVRLAALMGLPVVFVFTHDSIGVGEDGPTHQPIEHLASLRALPNLWVMRPADPNETAVAWRLALERTDGPTALALTRQAVPVLPDTAGAARGGYVVEGDVDPEVLLIGSGSELHLAVAARKLLAAEGVRSRVVSLPCTAIFDQQDAAYRESVLPIAVRARVAVEAACSLGWERYVGLDGAVVGLDRFGASAPADVIYRELGITAAAVAAAAHRVLGR
jgi:transketolase